jgi:hypothetical protein
MIRTTRSEQKIRGLRDIEALEGNAYETLVPSQTIYEVFKATATLFGDRLALTMLASAAMDEPPVTYTHAELLEEITRAANMFAQIAAGQIAPEPLPGRWRSDAMRACGSHGIPALQSHLLDHLESAGKGKSGMLMGVHPVGPPEWIGCLATSSLSNSIRMNTGYNLLELHN